MTSSPSGLGIVFLGCGQAARMHSKTLSGIGGVRLFYASREAGRAEDFRRQFAGARSYGSYEAAVADKEVDVALVTTPTSTHAELAKLALRAGKHVIVEKPAFLRSADVDDVSAAAAAAQRRVFVAENYAYKPITRFIEESVSSGDLGDVRFVSINATKRQVASDWRAEPAMAGGGALFEGGIHWVSFAASLGLEVESVTGARAGDPKSPERSTLVVFRYSNGAVGTLAHSWEIAAPLGGLRLSKVQGTSGAVTFESNGLAAVASGRRTRVAMFFSDFRGFRAMLEDFIAALTSSTQPRYTIEMARRDLRLVEQAERPAR